MLSVEFMSPAKEDRAYWKKTNAAIYKRIDKLIDAIRQNPFAGIGKPEPLKFQQAGYWSRRIDREHRIVYKVHKDAVYIIQCRYHYR